MCGLAGFIGPGDRASRLEAAGRMAAALIHRGPDGAGAWADEDVGVALAHRRLAVLDLSPAGSQPMASPCGRWVIAFNGEIYNHRELRDRLGPRDWRGHSDTETLLAAVAAWGIDKALRSLTGMFAFALWDKAERQLHLARDRLGEKPLHYGWQGRTLLFASELKALCAHPRWQGEIERSALASYMRYGYVPLPHTIYRDIRKLPPGTCATFPLDAPPGSWPRPTAYWSARDVVTRSAPERSRHRLDDATAIAELEARLQRAVGRQMISDVPLGALLSGGIDSSAVVAMMQAGASQPVQTFSIGFAEPDYDEAGHARAVAAHLGTAHTELYLAPADALAVIPRLPEIYDEPFGDSSAIPTHLVAQLARRHVTVALSGDGGDELFGGYNRYVWGRALWQRVGAIPPGLRRLLGRSLLLLPPSAWDRLVRPLRAGLPRRFGLTAVGDKLHKLAGAIDAGSPAELYRRLVSQECEPTSIVDADETPLWADDEAAALELRDISERMMFHDLVGYLTDDILAKVDRAAMAASLETRVPLLDHDLVEFAWQLPLHMRIRHGQGKWLLRQVLYRHVPRDLIERPKQGFGVPLDSWLRGPLRDWAEALLDEGRLRREGLLQAVPVRRKWQEHLSGRRNWQHWLWNVLMFQAWRERWHAP